MWQPGPLQDSNPLRIADEIVARTDVLPARVSNWEQAGRLEQSVPILIPIEAKLVRVPDAVCHPDRRARVVEQVLEVLEGVVRNEWLTVGVAVADVCRTRSGGSRCYK